MKESDNIEIRSEKVRNIIGQIPPRLIRLGSSVILFFFICLFLFGYFYKFEQNIKVPALIKKQNNHFEVNLFVSPEYYKFIDRGNKVYLAIGDAYGSNEVQFETQIEKIPDILQITEKDRYYCYKISISDTTLIDQAQIHLNIKDSLQIHANISTVPTSLLSWLFL